MCEPQPHNILSSIFLLPAEIRLCIYRHALINRRRVGRFSPGLVQAQIMVSCLKEPGDRTMIPALLRTNRQIYSEALPILYSENEFIVDQAKRFLNWLQQIGPLNIRLLKSLRIFPHAVYYETGKTCFDVSAHSDYSGPTWCKLLNKLADEATRLEYVYVYLDSEEVFGHSGAGRDLNFVRALGRMKVSRKMEIDGYFATAWPRYLERKMGMPVWNSQGRSQSYLKWLKEYQRGTQGLIP